MPAIPLTANSTVGDWLDHPEGGVLLRELLAENGAGIQVLDPARGLPLRQLAELSGGRLPAEVVDRLVRQVNGGRVPDEDMVAGWRERIVADRFTGRTVVVTGAASGIGRATAARIAREGGRVVAVDLAADGLAALAERTGAEPVPVDLTDPGAAERIAEAAGDQVDGLANVAGISDDFSPAHEVSDEMWRRIFAVNVDATLRLTRAVVPAMLEAGRGSVVNVASEAALRGSAAGVAYTASKHAVVGITRSCAFMYGPRGLRFNAVAPGGVATGIAGDFRPDGSGYERLQPFHRLMPPIATPEQLAASITFLLSDDGVNLNGAILPSDGGWSVQ
ncbi:SDR family NAD(P)-dependent oxidoreductase [Amycolatopsis jiangsuensis]|uniref:NAD(P)-dependent dehydrogenase (Short-subunit alcohol dehydrogenase family) n=1 Tax=Amycolatopsis jiangsuensis TaxID=1181879 RepID=A0A840IPY9_9PSEU|nr:SDR family oxidoreductase [Amycolatopsis jiangsuensis]MBB4684456.1 NAD(P)-dependent dehydrogenase (short-subunit alcohol dehydrogenase family) [Amycolatopsis jiangsuensis]